MAQNHEEVAKMMEELGCTGEHITASGINERIVSIDFQTIELAGNKFMYCGIKMLGGFVVTGKPAACIDPANWRDEIGQKVSFDNTFSEIWRLEAYRKMSEVSAVERIAKVAHEINKAYCEAMGDITQPSWEDAPQWQKDSAYAGVEFHLANPDASASASHDNWAQRKLNEGWKYGPVKNPETKEHPCLVVFRDLPKQQQTKDYLFRQTVHSLS